MFRWSLPFLSRFLQIVEPLWGPCKASLQWEAPPWNRLFRCCRWIISSTRWQQFNTWPLGYQILGTAHITYQHLSLIKQHISYFSRYPVHYEALCGRCKAPLCGTICADTTDGSSLLPDGSSSTHDHLDTRFVDLSNSTYIMEPSVADVKPLCVEPIVQMLRTDHLHHGGSSSTRWQRQHTAIWRAAVSSWLSLLWWTLLAPHWYVNLTK